MVAEWLMVPQWLMVPEWLMVAEWLMVPQWLMVTEWLVFQVSVLEAKNRLLMAELVELKSRGRDPQLVQYRKENLHLKGQLALFQQGAFAITTAVHYGLLCMGCTAS